jgi:hypothetical protein
MVRVSGMALLNRDHSGRANRPTNWAWNISGPLPIPDMGIRLLFYCFAGASSGGSAAGDAGRGFAARFVLAGGGNGSGSAPQRF